MKVTTQKAVLTVFVSIDFVASFIMVVVPQLHEGMEGRLASAVSLAWDLLFLLALLKDWNDILRVLQTVVFALSVASVSLFVLNFIIPEDTSKYSDAVEAIESAYYAIKAVGYAVLFWMLNAYTSHLPEPEPSSP